MANIEHSEPRRWKLYRPEGAVLYTPICYAGPGIREGAEVEVVDADAYRGAVEALRAIRERLRAAEAPDSDVLTAHDIADDWLTANARGQ